MQIYEGIEIVNLALYIKKYKALIISDLQIGYEESLANRGIFVPRLQFKLIKDRLTKIFSKVKPELVIINGDLKHEFGLINNQEWKDALAILDFIGDNSKKIILIKGNHDVILGPIAKKRDISLVDFYRIDSIFITHGHKFLLKVLNSKIIIIGHEHPAVSLREGVKVEKYKCFLKGTYNKSILIVMPSFNMLNEGSDILKEQILSPFLRRDLYNFYIYIVEDEVYKFGKVKNLK